MNYYDGSDFRQVLAVFESEQVMKQAITFIIALQPHISVLRRDLYHQDDTICSSTIAPLIK